MWEQRTAFTFDLEQNELFINFNVDRLLRADIHNRFGAEASHWAAPAG